MGRLWVGPKTGMGFCTRLRGHKRREGRDPAAARFFAAGPPQKKEGDGAGCGDWMGWLIIAQEGLSGV